MGARAVFGVCLLALASSAASAQLVANVGSSEALIHAQLAAVPASQVQNWLDTAANHTGDLTGYVYYETNDCLDSTSCTQAAEVAISEWKRNANNSDDKPIDCSAYLLLTARTDFVGLNATWQQLYNPLAQYYVAATNNTADAQGDCGWVVRVTPGTERLLKKAYPSMGKANKANTCGTIDDLCCEPKACSCFPGNGVVQLEDGSIKTMSELQLGDKVAASDGQGRIFYDHIYAFGHRDHSAGQSFVKLSTATATLRLTSGHYLAVSSGPTLPSTLKRAADVVVGEFVRTTSADERHTAMQEITDISTTYESGLFNPYTLSGSIIVDGMAASAHSEWFLDHYVQSPMLVSLLPGVYQAVLAPARALWYLLGKDRYVAIYEHLDQVMGLDQVGRKYGGLIFGAASTLMTGSLLAVISHKVKT